VRLEFEPPPVTPTHPEAKSGARIAASSKAGKP
jgi:hypothetical protein